jgi:hypothetical protein
MERRGFNYQAWHWMDINIMLLHILSWWVMVLPPCLRIFQVDTTHYNVNEFHYITLNHLYLLDYNYIVIPFPSGFCECMSSCERCARIPHNWAQLFWFRLSKGYCLCPKLFNSHALTFSRYFIKPLGSITYILEFGKVLHNPNKT